MRPAVGGRSSRRLTTRSRGEERLELLLAHRDLAAAAQRIRFAAASTARAGVARLEHGGVARLLEDLADEPFDTGEAQLDGDRPVVPLADDLALLARPARALRRDPDARDARGA